RRKGDYAIARKRFDATMLKVLAGDKLESTWKSLETKMGPFKKRLGDRAEAAGQYDFVYVTCEFEKRKTDIRVVFDKDKKIAGFFAQTTPKPTEFSVPSYADRTAFSEEDVIVGKGSDWPLPATLTLPKGPGPFPAAILVHGSGPHDRDETIEANKPFRDLAWGLASKGVAVLRYTKRSKEHGKKLMSLPSVTVQVETIDDAKAAVALLQSKSAIDPQRIFIIGHSLGAFAAPRIGEQEPNLAGIALLAGNLRPLEDLIVEQFAYLYSLQGDLSDSDRDRLDKIKKSVAKVKGSGLTAETPKSELPLNVPATYWLWLRAYNPSATAARLSMPILILQGERDYQVTMADFAGWQKALAGHKNALLKSYPALNHLFMRGSGKATPDEYNKPGHVAKEVIDDLAAWIEAKRR
ncbi:MAG: alpha/beta fold hydrolase, partial [Candidatus Acidiferrum sp.]